MLNQASELPSNEPGALDNLLRLDPNDPDMGGQELEKWEDGKTYTFTDVQVRQVSPGQYEVLKATPQEGPGEPAGENTAPEDTESGSQNQSGYQSPAVERLMTG